MVYFFSLFLFLLPGIFFYLIYRISGFFGGGNLRIIGVVSMILAILYPLSVAYNMKYHGLLGKYLVTFSAVILGIVTIGIGVMIFFEIINLISRFFKYNLKHIYTGYILVGVISTLVIYSLINALRPIIVNVDVQIPGLENNKRIVYMSDLHIDSIHALPYLQYIIDQVNNIEADFVIINGDFIDSTAFDDNSFALLNTINKEIFFTFGNHEKYAGNDYVRKLFKPTKVNILENRVVEYNGLQLIGIQDLQGIDNKANQNKLESILSGLTIDKTLPTIMILHEPIGPHISQKYGVDLQVAGHTHYGQIFPFTLLVKIAFPYIKGLYDVNGMNMFVSVGAGTWGPPMRLGSKSEIVVLHLKGK
ncbi:MAG: metallophosphoesterase [Candidatus Absconditabacteria bacterium]